MALPTRCLLRLQRIDQFNGWEEAHSLAMMRDRLRAQRRRQMRLARAGPTDQNTVMFVRNARSRWSGMRIQQRSILGGDLSGCCSGATGVLPAAKGCRCQLSKIDKSDIAQWQKNAMNK